MTKLDDLMAAEWTPTYGNRITRDVTSHLAHPDDWLVRAVFRIYDSGESPGVRKGISIAYWGNRLEQPILIGRRLDYIVPGSSCGWKKVGMFEGIYRRLACQSAIPRVLCGDFNSPQSETLDGRLVTWGEKVNRDGEIVVQDRCEQWGAGERSVLQGLAEYDLYDVFRRLHGHDVQAFIWFVKRKGQVIAKRRFDHILVCSDLNPTECHHLTGLRQQGLSDHASIEAVFAPVAQ